MSIFQRDSYTSDVTQFIESLKAKNPQLEKAQRDGRALLWDTQVNNEIQKDVQAGRVAQKPYPYQTNA